MAKLEMDPPYRHVRGRIGGLVYRRNGDGTAISKARRDDVPPTGAQLEVQRKFTEAAAYAKASLADPVLGPRYSAAAEVVGQRPFAFALADFLKNPVVEAIDVTDYHGAVGDVIKVRAVDDFEVTRVTVEIRDGANAVLEQGAAVQVGGAWHYTATTAIAAGTPVTVAAVATDRPGHFGTREVPLAVA